MLNKFGIFEVRSRIFLKLNFRVFESLTSKHLNIKYSDSNFPLLTSRKSNNGFTLVELLVVISIVAILSSVGFVVYTQLSARSRDATRISDLDNLKNAIQLSTQSADNLSQAYCAGVTAPCQGATFPTSSSMRKADGSGWIKVDFNSSNIANLSQLPIDPLNNARYNFVYTSDGNSWEIDATLESNEYQNLMSDDGGNNNDRYEVGTDIKNL